VHHRADATADEPPHHVQRGARGGQGHRLQPGRHLGRAAGVRGGEQPAVAGVGGLKHVEHSGAPHLADDDAVRPHAQGVADQLAQGTSPRPATLGGRDSSRTMCGPARWNSAVFSTV
jgi:hypothetical protein